MFIRVKKDGELASNIDSEIHIFGDEYERRELGELAESIKDFLRDNPGTIKSQVPRLLELIATRYTGQSRCCWTRVY